MATITAAEILLNVLPRSVVEELDGTHAMTSFDVPEDRPIEESDRNYWEETTYNAFIDTMAILIDKGINFQVENMTDEETQRVISSVTYTDDGMKWVISWIGRDTIYCCGK